MGKRTPVSTTPAPSPAKHAVKTDGMLEAMQADINKEFGEGIAQPLSSALTLSKIDHFVSTRSIVVDAVLRGGRPVGSSLLPFGRQTEISGLPGTGKTTLAAHIAAEVQQLGGFVVVTDTEERIDHPYWSSLGVDTGKILNLTCRTLEEVFERQYKFIEMCAVKYPTVPVLMLWDSLGGTSTDSILSDTDAKGHTKKDSIMERAKKAMMVKAKLISAGMEIINPIVARSRVAYVYTNTLYQKPDVDYGDPWETPGGNKKNFFATVRIRLRIVGNIVEDVVATGGKNVVGQRMEITALKNSMAPMKKTLTAAIIGGKGYSNDFTVREIAESMKKITKSGSWSVWNTPQGEEVNFQGWRGFQEKVISHAEYPDLVQQVVEVL